MNNPLSQVRQKEEQVLHNLNQTRQSAVQRFPLLFTMLGAFGLVATFYGFEGIIDRIDLFTNNPVILLIVGVVALMVTGTLYKKLG